MESLRNWRFWAGSLGGAAVIVLMILGGGRIIEAFSATPAAGEIPAVAEEADGGLPSVEKTDRSLPPVIARAVLFRTTIPERTADWVSSYTVQKGDSVEAIARMFELTDESIVWGNTDLLSTDANFLQPGQDLTILPVDGAFYRWKESDDLKSVADTWNTTVDAILNWPGNGLNPLSPDIYPDQWLILPGGWRPYDWEAAVVYTGKSSTYALGAGMCSNGYDGPVGTGDWMWPTVSSYHWLSGNDWLGSAHPGIDIAIYLGMPITAVDSGVVVYAGWSQNRDGTPGYGNLVIIDHLNGWHTFYAHLLQVNVRCGQPIYGGMAVGLGGSTGNSTGPHLHFEMRYGTIPQNPWGVLPAP
jgi:hypothetical protein